MADEQANLIIKLKDEATAGLNKLKAGYLAVTAAVGGLIAIGVKAINAFAEEEKEINKLNQALRNQGITSELASKGIQAYAAEIQKTTAFSDTAVIKQAALLTSFGLVGDKMKQASAAARDLSAGLGIDLNTATLLVGKAFAGEIGTLARYGIKVKEGSDKAETFTNVMDALNQRFGGQAAAQMNTYAGRVENLKNNFDDLQEKIGKELIPVAETWLRWMNKAIEVTGRFVGLKDEDLSITDLAIQKLEAEKERIILLGQAKGFLNEQEQARIGMIGRQLEALTILQEQETQFAQQQLLDQQAKANSSAIIDEDANKRRTEASKKRLAELRKTLNDEVAYNRQIQGQIVKDKDKADEIEKIRQQNMLSNLQSTLGNIASLQNAHNKFLAGIGKAAAYAAAIINTSLGITIALRSTPFAPVNIALASAVAAAGAAQIALISGTKLAEGGIVLPRQGGMQATIGEAGKAEAVIPLGDDRAKEQLQEAGLGNTINISVGTLVGSDGMREFAKIIDQELFSLRKNNESVALDAI